MIERNFFALEGLDGVGKSTVRDGLGECGFRIIKTPTEELAGFRGMFEKQDSRVRFMYYLTTVLHASHKARQYTAHEKVVCDRYLLTTVAAHDAMGMPVEFMSSCMPIIRKVPIPERTFILTASKQERVRRMTSRPGGANETDMANEWINGEILSGYRKWSKSLGHEIVKVDTTNMRPEEVVDFVAGLT